MFGALKVEIRSVVSTEIFLREQRTCCIGNLVKILFVEFKDALYSVDSEIHREEDRDHK